MTVLKWILIGLGSITAVGAVIITGGLVRLSRTQPETQDIELGAENGILAPCPDSPNCVSTQADASDGIHYVEPIPYDGDAAAVIARLSRWIQDVDRAELVESEDAYLRAMFSSRIFGFKDDVEVYAAEDVVHLRSASRVGYGDMGANRARYQQLRDVISATTQ